MVQNCRQHHIFLFSRGLTLRIAESILSPLPVSEKSDQFDSLIPQHGCRANSRRKEKRV